MMRILIDSGIDQNDFMSFPSEKTHGFNREMIARQG